MNTKGISFMAIAKGSDSNSAFKRYRGVASCSVIGVNPNGKEMSEIFKKEQEDEPEYVKDVDRDDKTVKQARVTFIVVPDAKAGDNKPQTVTFFISNEYWYNKNKDKVQIIDKYGRTAWATIEQAKNHEIPMYSNGPAKIDKDYRPAYVGEEKLTNFLIAYLNIPSVEWYNKEEEKWHKADHPEDCECRLDSIEKLFKGDFSEIKEAIALQPNNKVKILFGIRTTEDGKQYQQAYTDMFLKNSVTNYSRLDADVQNRKAAGSYKNTEFATCPYSVYEVEATNFEPAETTEDAPFAQPTETDEDPFALE